MADSATPQGSDPNAPKRETLRISLPPRPLRPASTKITPTPRPNVSAATTLPMNTSGELVPAPATNVPPAWSTAVTKPMPSISKVTTAVTPEAPPKSVAPPMTGAPASAKTTPLFPQKPPTQPVTTLGQPKPVAPQPPATHSQPDLNIELKSPSGRLASPTARVIVANPQAKVFVQSGRVEVPPDLEPIPHRSRPPNLPATQPLTGVPKSEPVPVPKIAAAPPLPAAFAPAPAVAKAAPAAEAPATEQKAEG